VPQLEQEIRQFVVDNFLFGEDSGTLGNDDSLRATGTIDSTGVLELVSFLERSYGITVEDDELMPENLDSVRKLVAFVERKRRAGQ
jgi:acyl carrier protein